MIRFWCWRRRPQADYVTQLKRWAALPSDNKKDAIRPLALPAIQPLKAQKAQGPLKMRRWR